MVLLLEDPLDVINGKVLLARLDHLFPQRIRFGSILWTLGRGQKEEPSWILSKVVNQDAKTAFRITKAAGGLLGGELFDKERAEGFVLAMGGIGWLKEGLGRIS